MLEFCFNSALSARRRRDTCLIGEETKIKNLFTFTTKGKEPGEQSTPIPVLAKKFARDIRDDLEAPNGTVLDKPEGLTVAADGQVLLVTDNDGVDDTPGETQFQNLGTANDVFGPKGGRTRNEGRETDSAPCVRPWRDRRAESDASLHELMVDFCLHAFLIVPWPTAV